MPVTWLQFELGGKDTPIEKWMRRIQAYLRDNGDLAYSETELREELACKGEPAPDDEFCRALDLLTEFGSLDQRFIPKRNNTYYKYIAEIPELPALAANPT